MNSTEYCLTSLLGSNKKLPSIVITPIAEGGDVAINQSNNSLNGSAISTLEMENAKPRPRRRAYSESQVYRRPAFLTPLSSKARSRLLNGSIKRGMPKQFNCRTVRIRGIHQIGADDDHKINYRANFTILRKLASTTSMMKEVQRLDNMSAHIIDYKCSLLETKPPGVSGNTISDLLSSSLIRTINPIKRLFTEVNKFRMLSTTSKDFLNTVGIYCYKGKSSRTNLRSIMYDVTSEPDYPLCVVNVGKKPQPGCNSKQANKPACIKCV